MHHEHGIAVALARSDVGQTRMVTPYRASGAGDRCSDYANSRVGKHAGSTGVVGSRGGAVEAPPRELPS